QLAVLDERRSTVARELTILGRQAEDLESRAVEAERQILEAGNQQEETRQMIESLELTRAGLASERVELDRAIAQAADALAGLRDQLRGAEAKWDESRGLLDSWKDRHNALEIEKTQVDSDLKHLSESCLHELGESIESVCLKYFDALPPMELEA